MVNRSTDRIKNRILVSFSSMGFMFDTVHSYKSGLTESVHVTLTSCLCNEWMDSCFWFVL